MDDGGGGVDDTLSQIIWYGVGLNYANIGWREYDRVVRERNLN